MQPRCRLVAGSRRVLIRTAWAIGSHLEESRSIPSTHDQAVEAVVSTPERWERQWLKISVTELPPSFATHRCVPSNAMPSGAFNP